MPARGPRVGRDQPVAEAYFRGKHAGEKAHQGDAQRENQQRSAPEERGPADFFNRTRMTLQN